MCLVINKLVNESIMYTLLPKVYSFMFIKKSQLIPN